MDIIKLGPIELGTVNELIYPFVVGQKLTFLSLSNRTAGNIAVSIYFVPSGGSPSNSNLFVPGLVVAAHDVWLTRLSLPFEGGDSVWSFAAAAGINLIALFERIPIATKPLHPN